MNVVLIAIFGLLGAASAQAQPVPGHLDHATHLGASVMPFDLGRSTHVFTPTRDGIGEVVSKDGDAVQVALIRGHLRKEAAAFTRGDYADPASIHGQAMPGASRVRVRYENMANGARVRFTTQQPKLVDALHRWFAAQVNDHGADATMRR